MFYLLKLTKTALIIIPCFFRPNVGFLFVSSFYYEEFDSLKDLISARVPSSGFQLIGCSAVGVIGTHHETHLPHEIEDGQPAVSITLVRSLILLIIGFT